MRELNSRVGFDLVRYAIVYVDAVHSCLCKVFREAFQRKPSVNSNLKNPFARVLVRDEQFIVNVTVRVSYCLVRATMSQYVAQLITVITEFDHP